MARTHVILDGLQDPAAARDLSRRWAEAGFDNAVDVAGMAAWLGGGGVEGRGSGVAPDGAGGTSEVRTLATRAPRPATRPCTLSEADLDRAIAIARTVGVELRDRSGVTFIAANTLEGMRERMKLEYRARLATAAVFVGPALALHYFGAVLAGGPAEPRGMLYPWLFAVLLTGWAWWSGGWPIVWRGGQGVRAERGTGGLRSTRIAAGWLGGEVAGLVGLVAGGGTWLTLERGGGPMTHAAGYALLLALLQRRLAWSNIERLAGRGDVMIPSYGRLVGLWLAAAVAVGWWQGLELGLAVALLLPPMLSLGAVHRSSPGVSMALPVVGFAALLVFGPERMGVPVRGLAVEIAAGFGALMTAVFAAGWRGWDAR